jgi:hypothetical protein
LNEQGFETLVRDFAFPQSMQWTSTGQETELAVEDGTVDPRKPAALRKLKDVAKQRNLGIKV